jgi:hypothetical protein
MSSESHGTTLLIALLAASLVRPFALAVAAWLILRVLRVSIRRRSMRFGRRSSSA